jgi:uncharacterized membrane protein YdjX (TVP38/TMEM64 family)
VEIRVKKLVLFLLFISIVLVLYFLTPLRQHLSPEGIGQVHQWIRHQGAWAPLVFSLIYILAVLFALPGSVLTISGGILFGTAWGTLLSLTSATLGASLAFLISRYLGRDFVAKITQGRIQKIDDKIGRHGFYTVLYLRLVPIFPFNVLNFSLGLTKVKFRDYFFGSLFGMIPGAFVYASMGGASEYIDLKDPRSWLDYRVWGPFVLIILLTLIPKLIQRFRSKG